jgi:hypothetical protein
MAIKINSSTVINDSRVHTSTGDTTGAIYIPTGTTGQQPTNAAGALRYNTSTGSLEISNGTAFSAIGAAATGSDIFNANFLGAL